MVKNPPTNAGNTGLMPGLGRSPGGGNGNSLQYSCLENSMERGVWCSTVHGVAESNMTEQLSPYKFLLSKCPGPYIATSLVL